MKTKISWYEITEYIVVSMLCLYISMTVLKEFPKMPPMMMNAKGDIVPIGSSSGIQEIINNPMNQGTR